MAQKWEYTHMIVELCNTQHGRKWCWRSSNGLYALEDALDQYGEVGWELVSLTPECFTTSTYGANPSASFQRAVFKKPVS